MGATTEWLNALEFTAESPDGTVRARLSVPRPVEIRLSPQWRRHSEKSLSEQAESVVQDVLVAYQETVSEWQFGGRDPLTLARTGDEFARTQLRFQRAVTEIAAAGTSPTRYVDVEWRGTADVRITIRRDTVGRLSRAQLTGEIEAALAAAGSARGEKVLAVSERIHGPTPLPPYKGD